MKLLKWLNPLLAILFVVQMFTVIALYTMTYTEFLSNLHRYGGTAFLLLGAVHLYLNRSWVKATYFKRKKY